MIEDHKKLLAVLEVRLRDLMALCDKQKERIGELEMLLAEKDERLLQAVGKINELNVKCDNILTARVISVDETELKSAKSRLSKLVREVDKCIALLNE